MKAHDTTSVVPVHESVPFRRTMQALAATVTIMAIVLGAVALVAGRAVNLTDPTGELELRPSDGFLAVLVITAILVLVKLVSQTRSPGRLTLLPRSVRSAIRRLVETSYFGTGSLWSWTATNPTVGLDRVRQPEVDGSVFGDEAEVTAAPAGILLALVRESLARLEGRGKQSSDPSAEPMVEHVVRRGETFWSLAESKLGDGRRWSEIRAVNVGHEVAPGVILGADDMLVRGWRVLMPISEVTEEPVDV